MASPTRRCGAAASGWGQPSNLVEHGAFVASDAFTGIRDLAGLDVAAAFAGAHDAMVSYPLLLAPDGSNRVRNAHGPRANRSFVAQDERGWIILGTTRRAFFTLHCLADLLRQAPLGLVAALNLDGGPVACQAIVLGGYSRWFCGHPVPACDGSEICLPKDRAIMHQILPLVVVVTRN